MNLHTALVWLREHWSLAWPVVSALLLLVLRSRTPEEWVALGERSPRWQGVIRLLRAVGLDPSKTVSALTQIVTGRAPTRSVAAADAIGRALGPASRAAERGHARTGALLAVVVLALGAYLVVGCGPAREAVMRVAPGVPEAVGCAAGTQRCNGQLPEVCSSSGRWWPSLPVRPDGSQRECVSCVVEDGVAGCVL